MHIALAAVGFGLVTSAIAALGAVGFSMQFSVTNILNIAYGDVMIATAFAVYYLTRLGVNVWVGLALGALIGAALSYLLNRGVFSLFIRRGVGLFGMVIVTLAVGVMIQNGLLAISGISFVSYKVPEGPTVHLGAISWTGAQIAIMVVAVVLMLAVHALLRHTRLGKSMRATASNPSLASVSGIAVRRVIDAAWLISGALCGVAGVALGISLRTFQSSSGSDFLVVLLAAAVLGGIGSAYGAMLGSLIVGLATEVSAAFVSPGYKDAFAFILLVIFLVLRPNGFLGRPVAADREFAA